MIFMTTVVFSAPKEIIIIRHADKLIQPKPGPCLSPQGEIRSIQFAYYFLKKFGEPNYIFAKDATIHNGKLSSIRELQTVAPLANLLAEKHPNQGFPLLSFPKSDYQKLAADLLTNSKFQGKTVLICWDHELIPLLAEKLGVIPRPKKWASHDFDTVYWITYDSKGNISSFKELNNQYPVVFNGSWETISQLVKN